ncbi:MAG: L-threonylcarbamoyladenylate synthase [Acidimicrobiaceae bacterium]|nr:L-threonylcarbamoyladenylate synthase [Acidimicrobiaceae bacterium]MDE0607842.1 L-threonylcarbamoyladenylate synthase [Acidimicrobiaceae bacterium]
MSDLDRVVAALRAGQVVLLPTDTVYGLAVMATNSEALAAVFALKRRPIDTSVAVLVADAAQAARYVDLGLAGNALAERFWPGALTIVANRIDDGALAAGNGSTIGVRCPDDAFVRSVAALVGPVAASSANVHGEPTPELCADAARIFDTVEIAVDGGPREGSASTVVSIVDGAPVLLREGPVSIADITAAVNTGT